IDGFTVDTPKQWMDGLAELCTSVALRQHMGEEARQRVQTAFSVDAIYPRWRTILREVIDASR
ncbi:MAG: glycosyltransferase, partial [Rhodocyclaceae bacterium]